MMFRRSVRSTAYSPEVEELDESMRGAVARSLVAQDARWLIDVVRSSQRDPHLSSVVGLSFIGHFSRVAFEGARIAMSPEPHVGVPALADLLSNNHADVIERARHATKLLDDRKKSISDLEAEVASYYELHKAEFTGNAVWFARWAESDLALATIDRRLIVSSIPNQLRFGLAATVDQELIGPSMRSVSEQLGSVVIVLAALDGTIPSTQGFLDLSALRSVKFLNRRAARYLDRRFDPVLSDPAKLLLLLVEGEVNLATYVLPLTRSGHEESVLRAQFINATHAVRAVRAILDACPSAISSGTQRVRRLLAEPRAGLFADDFNSRQVRNQSVHYRLRSDLSQIDATRPMYGLVEALWEGQTYEKLEMSTSGMLFRLGEALHEWRASS